MCEKVGDNEVNIQICQGRKGPVLCQNFFAMINSHIFLVLRSSVVQTDIKGHQFHH